MHLDTVIDAMSSTELDYIADQLPVILGELHLYANLTLGSVTGSPYNSWYMP